MNEMLKYEKPLLLDLEEVSAAENCCDTSGGTCPKQPTVDGT
ncbi:MAG TPA: hypothetical protein VFR81_15985 [Longimicrobium sp.]|nr:hypothetical protein [Longimicrobium sp.]